MFGYIRQQDTQAQWHCQQFLDGAAQWTRTLCRAKALFAQQVYRAIVGIQRQSLLQEASSELIHLQARYGPCLLLAQWREDHHFIDAIKEFWPECRAQSFHQALALHFLGSTLDV